jgi:hypothetical protein
MFAKTNAYFLTNYLPYTLTLTSPVDGTTGRQNGDQGEYPWTSNLPYASIPPGGDSWFELISETTIIGTPMNGNWASCELNYDFTDINGGKHRCTYTVNNSGYVWVVSMDLAADGTTYVGSTEVFQITPNAGPHQNVPGYEACTILSKPAEVTIDAGQDLAGATSVMANLWPQGTDPDYTPTTGVTYTPNSPWARGSAMVVNGTSADVSLTMLAGDSTSETTSLDVTLAWSTTLSILGLVNQKLSASISGGESWQQSVSLSSSEGMTIPAGQQGWLEWCTTSAQVTGDFTFTWTPPSGGYTPAGITYHVNNVTITQPGYSAGSVTWQPNSEAIPSPASSIGGSVKATLAPPFDLAAGDSATVIDAATDPADANTAMALWSNATNKQFTPTTNPVYSATQPQIVSSRYQVPATWKNPESFSFNSTQTTTSGWSLGGSVGAETTLGVVGFANASVSVEFTAKHEWDTTSTDSQTIEFDIPPGHIGWVTGSTGQVTYTGDFAFTANSTNYVVKNVTITNPGSPDCGPKAAFTYYAVVEELAPSVADSIDRPGLAAEAGSRQELAPAR